MQSPLADGDLVMLFTDGLYEVEGPGQQLYSHEMLANAVRKPHASFPLSELFDEFWREIKEFALGQDFMDDVCLVGMEAGSLRRLAANNRGRRGS